MEAGNRCFDQRIPEETNRKIVDNIWDVNLTYSDSGTISEESSILSFNALNIRQVHEMPEASVMMVGLNTERILQGLEVLKTQEKNTLGLVGDYSMTNVYDKVLRIILSYTDYINKVIWCK